MQQVTTPPSPFYHPEQHSHHHHHHPNVSETLPNYYYDYESSNYPSNVLSSLFGYSKAHSWFSEILGCLRPFWTIIGSGGSGGGGGGRPSPTGGEYGDDDDGWEIPFEQLKDLRWLGAGAQGAVFMGQLFVELFLNVLVLTSFFFNHHQASTTTSGWR